MKANLSIRILLLSGIALLRLFFLTDPDQYPKLSKLKARPSDFKAFCAHHPAPTIAVLMDINIGSAADSLPGAAVMPLAGGALYSLWTGLPATGRAPGNFYQCPRR